MKMNFKIDGSLLLQEDVAEDIKKEIERNGKENTASSFCEIIKQLITDELSEDEFRLNESMVSCTAEIVE